MKFLVSSRFLILSFVLLFNSVTIALASSHIKIYQIYERFSKQECSQHSRNMQCGGTQVTERYCEYSTTYVQVSVTATRCQRGWGPEPNCDDFDECRYGSHGCAHTCTNTFGSYVCSCNVCYRLASDGRACNDIDECTARLDNCTELVNFICENTIGGYQCVCKFDFEQVGPHECRDIDECKTLSSNCTLDENMICENTIGGYKCHRDSNRTSMDVGVTVGVIGLVGIILMIITVYFVGRARQRKKHAKESTERRPSPEIQYEEVGLTIVDVLARKKPTKQEQCSGTTNLCSTPESAERRPLPEIQYEEVVVPAKKKPNKPEQCSSTPPESTERRSLPEIQYEEVDVAAKKKPNKQEQCSGTITLCSTPAVLEDSQNEAAGPSSEYEDLGTVEKPTTELYETIRKPSKSSDVSVQGEDLVCEYVVA